MTAIDLPWMTIAGWVFAAVSPVKPEELWFSEFVHIIAYFSMFGRKEIVRFLFGQVDVDTKFFIKKPQFVELIDNLMEGQTNRAPRKYSKQFDDFMNPQLRSMFLSDFQAFVDTNPSVLWQVELFQKRIMQRFLGEKYWILKREQFMKVRKDLNVVMS